jgi:putative flippase GtrA
VEIIKTVFRLQVFRFLLVGLFCASIEYLTFNVFINAFKIEYLVANVISIVIAVSINYLLSRAFVFEKSKYSKRDEFLSFVLFSVLAIVLNQLILWMFFEIIKLDIRLCKALAIIIVAFFNFLTKKYIVFKV